MPAAASLAHDAAAYPDNPVLARAWRGAHPESVHRGAWALVDAGGTVVESGGVVDAPYFARSTIKCLQALPLLESGAADRFGVGDLELALALASHNAEPYHTEPVQRWLERIGLSTGALRCGAHPPSDAETRRALLGGGGTPTALHNNCSGKHTGFLTLARHLGQDPATYLEPDGAVQSLVREAVADTAGVDAASLGFATDGCSAPTWHLPLTGLATAFARVANPDGLRPERREACRRMTAAVAQHPAAIAGHRKRVCSDIARVTGGRLFPKAGAEGLYAVGVAGADRGLAIKVDDGGTRGLHAVLLGLLERFGFLAADELDQLDAWRPGALTNHAGLEVGRLEVLA